MKEFEKWKRKHFLLPVNVDLGNDNALRAAFSAGMLAAAEICRTAKLGFYRDRIIEVGESDLIDLALLDVARQIESKAAEGED